MSNDTTRWAARLAGAGAAVLAGCSSVRRRIWSDSGSEPDAGGSNPGTTPTETPTAREPTPTATPPATDTESGSGGEPTSPTPTQERAITPAGRPSYGGGTEFGGGLSGGGGFSGGGSSGGGGATGGGGGATDTSTATPTEAPTPTPTETTTPTPTPTPDSGTWEPRVEVVAVDGSPEQYSDAGQATVANASDGYLYLLDVDRGYRTTVSARSADGSAIRWSLVEAAELEDDWATASPLASFERPGFEFGPFTLGAGRTAVVVEPLEAETTVEYGLDMALPSTDDGSTDDGSTDDGSTDDGSTDDGSSDDPIWFSAVGAFRAAPPNPVAADQADWTASDRDSFVEAIRNASAGDVIWIPGSADVDMTGWANLDLPDGVTIASDRNVPEDRPGGRIYVGDTDNRYLFKTNSSNVRVTGLRLEGPHTEWIKSYDSSLIRSFGMFYGDNCEFDNCEVYGWPFAGFAHGASGYAVSHEIHHNHFHDNLMEGLGYGVELYDGHHVLHHNYFDRCRHAIAGFGYATNGYEAYHNAVGPEPLSHAFDMHATEESLSDGSDVAGGTIVIRENLFQFTHDLEGRGQEAVAIRGVPDDVCRVEDNHFYHASQPTGSGSHGDAFRQGRVDTWTNFEFAGNAYDSSLRLRPP